jgi:hypothetical protein
VAPVTKTNEAAVAMVTSKVYKCHAETAEVDFEVRSIESGSMVPERVERLNPRLKICLEHRKACYANFIILSSCGVF